jgi:cytochrome c peroxidase
MTRVTCRVGLFVVILVGAVALKMGTTTVSADPQLKPDPGQQITCGGQPCDAVARGFRAFHDRRLLGLDGNGRACSDCHMPSDNFQLSPANAEARFQRLRARLAEDPDADDALFRPIDADDFRTNGQAASDYSNLRQNGLVRITFALPSNIRLIDPATNLPSNETFVDVWRMVPTVNDVKLTGNDGENPWPRGPNPTGGYQLDARQATLQDQAQGALLSHAEVQSLPSQQFLADPAAFQLTLFTNPRVRALADDDWNKFDVPALRGISATARTSITTALRRSRRWSTTTSNCSSSSRRRLQRIHRTYRSRSSRPPTV